MVAVGLKRYTEGMKKNTRIFFIVLGALALVRILVAIFTPVFDPSESRYAAMCANMAAHGDFLVPHFIHKGVFQSFDGKPPLLFQMGGIFCKMFGRTEFSVRLPSLLAAFGLLAILFSAVRRQKDVAAAGLAAGICFSSVAFYATAGLCMTDMLLTFCVSGALLLEFMFNTTPLKRYSLGVFALLGVGMIVKGPVAIVLFGLPAFLDAWINRRWKIIARHAWILGPCVFLLIAAPWYVLMARNNPGFLDYFFVHENFLRFLVHDYGDKYGGGRETFRGMAAVWAVVVTLPWAPLALFHVRRARPGFLALGMLSITGFWCLTSRVPLTYLMPVVPLFAAWFALQDLHPRVAKILPSAAGLAVLVLTGSLLVAEFTSSKLPGRAFKASLLRHPEGSFFFPQNQPYSAEFYLNGRLHLKPEPGDIIYVREGKIWKEAGK